LKINSSLMSNISILEKTMRDKILIDAYKSIKSFSNSKKLVIS